MASPPGVSVVIPTHNRPELMTRALASVLEQGYEGPLEALVVFDACEPFRPNLAVPDNASVRLLENRRRRGLAGARNAGIEQASHPFVAFLDDDDYWLPGKLEAQMERFASEPETALVGTAMIVDSPDGTFERLVPHQVITHAQLLRDRMPGLHSSTFVFRKADLVDRIGMVDEDLPGSYGEDYDLLLRTAEVGDISVVNRPMVSVTWSGQSYFFGQWSKYGDGLQYLLERHPGFHDDRRAVGRLTSQIAFARAAGGQRPEARRWAARSIRHDPRQVKAWLALAISLRLVSAERIIGVVQRLGRGI